MTAAALAGAAHLVPGIAVRSTSVLLISALVLGFVNAVIRPVLVILTLPITILTLGIFYLIVNGIALAFAAWLVPGFTVATLGSAVLGALAVSVISFLLNWLIESFRR